MICMAGWVIRKGAMLAFVPKPHNLAHTFCSGATACGVLTRQQCNNERQHITCEDCLTTQIQNPVAHDWEVDVLSSINFL